MHACLQTRRVARFSISKGCLLPAGPARSTATGTATTTARTCWTSSATRPSTAWRPPTSPAPRTGRPCLGRAPTASRASGCWRSMCCRTPPSARARPPYLRWSLRLRARAVALNATAAALLLLAGRTRTLQGRAVHVHVAEPAWLLRQPESQDTSFGAAGVACYCGTLATDNRSHERQLLDMLPAVTDS